MQDRTDLSNYEEWKFMAVSLHVLKFESWVHRSAYLRWKTWSLCMEDLRKINQRWGGLDSPGLLRIMLYCRCMCTVLYKVLFGDLELLQEHQSGCRRQFYRRYNEARDGGLSSVWVSSIVLAPCHTLPLWMHGAVFCPVMYSVYFSSILSPKLNRKHEIKIFRVPSNNWRKHRHKSFHIQKVLIYAKKAKAIAEKYKGQQNSPKSLEFGACSFIWMYLYVLCKQSNCTVK